MVMDNPNLCFRKHIKYSNHATDITSMRKKEFPNLTDSVYLDHTGATLYSKSQLTNYHEDLMKNLYGNPHSSCMSSEKTLSIIEDVKVRILSFFNTTQDKYHIIFTQNTTHAIKLIADNFKFHDEKRLTSSESWFLYLQDNHTSIVGMRGVALKKMVNVKMIDYEESAQDLLSISLDRELNSNNFSKNGHWKVINDHFRDEPNNLFAYPAMSNFSGRKYPLDWISTVQNKSSFLEAHCGKWFVLLDAASFVSTSFLDLSIYSPDFIPVSFYKLFGFPTGLGALLVNVRAAETLDKTYFGGGSVSAYSSDCSFHRFKSLLSDRHEDGTVPFLEILAVKYGFDALANLTGSMENIAKHTFFLAQYVYKELKELKHFNDHDVCHCYCDTAFKSSSLQGPIVNFNVMKSSGSYVGYAEVSKLAATYRIHLRTGCFCNVGACQHFLNLTSAQLCKHFEAGHVCGDSLDLIDGQPTGSIRISFGYMSDLSDANNFLQFIKECFVETTSPIATQRYKNDTDEAFLKRIFIYPIKSCAAFEVKEWDLCEKGLSYDREWLIVNESGSFISQKRVPRLCYITPVIDMDEEVMRLQAPGLSEFVLPIHMSPDQTDGNVVQPRICGSKVSGIDCGDDVAKWLTTFLGQKCRLIRQNPNVFRRLNADRFCSQALSLANNSQLVMINESSCVDLLNNINSSTTAQDKTCEMSVESLVYRFRPNIIISGIGAYVEETWGSLTISDVKFECVGLCFRCRMISVNPDSGELTKEPMRTLAQIRGSKVPFGIHLQRIVTQDKAIPRLSVGNYVKFHQS